MLLCAFIASPSTEQTWMPVQNAHAAAGGHLDAESSAAIEEQIKQQLAGKSVTPSNKEIETGPPNIVPAGNFTRHEAPVVLGEPDLSHNSQEAKVCMNTSLKSSCTPLAFCTWGKGWHMNLASEIIAFKRICIKDKIETLMESHKPI